MEVLDNSIPEVTERPGSHVIYFTENPHIHLHNLVEDSKIYRGEDGAFELTCHMCGSCVFIVFNSYTIIDHPQGHPSLGIMKDEFVELHKDCKSLQIEFGVNELRAEDFRLICHDKRSRTTTVSIRG